MSTSTGDPSQQLGFEDLLAGADQENSARRFARETAHLPDTMEEALAHYRLIIRRHHAAMMAGNVDQTMALREEARLLARRVNGGDSAILARADAPGCRLAGETAAIEGAVPLWGQQGNFILKLPGLRVRIALDGIFGIGCSACYWPGFAAHAVDLDKPFISETGYRSFHGLAATAMPDFGPDDFAAKVILTHIKEELSGKLVAIDPHFRAARSA